MAETLVILDSQSAATTLVDLQRRFMVRSSCPPRVVVLELDAQDALEIHQVPGVEAVIRGATEVLPASLSASERLYAESWQQHLRMHDKTRPGEGLPWDAPGFQHPDKPDKP